MKYCFTLAFGRKLLQGQRHRNEKRNDKPEQDSEAGHGMDATVGVSARSGDSAALGQTARRC